MTVAMPFSSLTFLPPDFLTDNPNVDGRNPVACNKINSLHITNGNINVTKFPSNFYRITASIEAAGKRSVAVLAMGD